jgi:peptide/nickel transport system substrate-binding protein
MTNREINLLVNSQDSLRTQVAQAIAEMLEAGGLKVNVVKKKGSSYTYALRDRTSYDLYLGQTKLSPNMDLGNFFSSYGSLNYGGLSDVTAYSFSKAALANHGNYYTLHEAVMEGGLLCPILFQSYGVFATRGKASFLTPARDNVFYYSTGKTLADALIDS